MSSRQYPDITDILARKAQGRRERASLSFAEKLTILDKLKKDVEPIVRARRERLLAVKERASRVRWFRRKTGWSSGRRSRTDCCAAPVRRLGAAHLPLWQDRRPARQR